MTGTQFILAGSGSLSRVWKCDVLPWAPVVLQSQSNLLRISSPAYCIVLGLALILGDPECDCF